MFIEGCRLTLICRCCQPLWNYSHLMTELSVLHCCSILINMESHCLHKLLMNKYELFLFLQQPAQFTCARAAFCKYSQLRKRKKEIIILAPDFSSEFSSICFQLGLSPCCYWLLGHISISSGVNPEIDANSGSKGMLIQLVSLLTVNLWWLLSLSAYVWIVHFHQKMTAI